MRIQIVIDGNRYYTARSPNDTKTTADALYDAIDSATKLQFTLEDGQELVLGPGIMQRAYFIVGA